MTDLPEHFSLLIAVIYVVLFLNIYCQYEEFVFPFICCDTHIM